MNIRPAPPRSIKRLALALPVFLVFSSEFALAKDADPVSLSPVWRMESDDDYSYYADYQPPRPVKGLVLHGYFADDSISVEDGQIILPPGNGCQRSIRLADPRHLPAGMPARTVAEFWFYRSGDQGLYLSRHWRFDVSNHCEGNTHVEAKIIHLSLFNGTSRFIEVKDGEVPKISAESLSEQGFYPIPEQLVVIDDRRMNARPRAGANRRRDDYIENTNLRRACFDDSETFSFATTCFLTERGPWHGLLLRADMQEDDGSAYSDYGVSEVQPKAWIDGRLFQWDRRIMLADE